MSLNIALTFSSNDDIMIQLDEETIQFIKAHESEAPNHIALQAKKYPHLDFPFILEQIEGRQRAKKKLPSWYAHDDIIFPPRISMEQCSSEDTATFKQTILKGKRGLDLTGGFGVDVSYIAPKFEEYHMVEQNLRLTEVAQHNFKVLGIEHITIHNQTAEAFLSENIHSFDWIYIDPDRRPDVHQRVVGIEACTPNILEIKESLLQKGKNILIKLSPMLDIKASLQLLPETVQVWIVSVKNECKEILFHLASEHKDVSPQIHCINLPHTTDFQFDLAEELYLDVSFVSPQNIQGYLYEPNTSILKGGAYKTIAQKFSLKKLHPNSHLYIHDQFIHDFPGRVFHIKDVCQVDRKKLKKIFHEKKANITIRNFPDSVEKLRKKLQLKEGGDTYIFASTNSDNQKVLIICEKP